jgi:hypothetical protein
MVAVATEPDRKKRLLECAKRAAIYSATDPEIVKLVTDFLEYRNLKSEVERLEGELRNKIENILLAQNTGAIYTSAGTVTAIARKRETLDKNLIPDAILEEAKRFTDYVELATKAVKTL